MVSTVLFLALALVGLVVLSSAVQVVPQSQVRIVERLGTYRRTLQPGRHLLVPVIDSVRATIDMREQVVSFPPQPVITRDNVTVSMGSELRYTVADPVRATYQVTRLMSAVEQLVFTTLRNVIGSLSLDEALASRDRINADLRTVLDEATEAWGLRVGRIEVKLIERLEPTTSRTP
jgi:regulator of protease activity HflC (stomatin/prohibitin superfamily)